MSESQPATVGHVVSLRTLVVVWIALLVGTWLTVSATYVDLGELNLWVGLAIATAKAALVALYFMHLRWDRPFNLLVFFTGLFFLALFIGLATLDTVEYQHEVNEAAAAGTAVGQQPPAGGGG